MRRLGIHSKAIKPSFVSVREFSITVFCSEQLTILQPERRNCALIPELRFPSNVEFSRIRTFLSQQFPNPLTLDTVIQINATETATVRDLSRPGAFRDLDPTIKIPESYQFNVGFERELFKGIVFESNFTVNKTVRLWREYNANAPVLPAGTPDRDGNGEINFTDYLLGINSGISRFFLGSRTDDVGLLDLNGGSCSANRNL